MSTAGSQRTKREHEESAIRTYPEGGAFSGVIGRTTAESIPAWPAHRRPAPTSPNVVVVLLDDVGFAQIGCFGSDIRTPTFDSLALAGLRYRQFHTTALCAPSRACLLTGRNHHTNGSGRLPEFPLGFPGYNMEIPQENGLLSEMLREHGYATFALGKWHLTPYREAAAGSSHRQWPLGRGFDRYYGFLGGRTSQWVPDLVYDNHMVAPPGTPEEGYHLNQDLADRGIEFIADLRAAEPHKPFFLYYCPGAGHDPHHVAREWADRYIGQFDLGWDAWREQVFARQLSMGVVPAGTALSPRPEWIAAWDTLGEPERRLYARQMEVYAAFLGHTDAQIGRVVGFLRAIGELDNTILIVTSDNGASAGGGPHGNNGHVPELATLEGNLSVLEEWGGPNTNPNYSWGWGWAGNTPLRRWKRNLHEGGITDPLILHWPRGIEARGEIRGQYTHITDIVPTILEVLGLDAPRELDGKPQSALHGVTFASTFDDADAPSRKAIQYYEMIGSRAIWSDGWKAVADQVTKPLLTEEDLAAQRWELYRVADDVSECSDLATTEPERLSRLVEQWWTEAGTYGVLPLDASWEAPKELATLQRAGPKPFVFYSDAAPLPSVLAPNVFNRSHRIVATVEVPEGGAEGVLLAHGGGFHGGYALYVKERRLHYVHNYAGIDDQRVTSDTDVPEGLVTLRLVFTKTADHQGTARLYIGERPVGQGMITRTMPAVRVQGLCCGYDGGLAVTTDYRVPFRFSGTLERVIVEVDDDT